MATWEYKVVNLAAESDIDEAREVAYNEVLNEYGRAGWELVAVTEYEALDMPDDEWDDDEEDVEDEDVEDEEEEDEEVVDEDGEDDEDEDDEDEGQEIVVTLAYMKRQVD